MRRSVVFAASLWIGLAVAAARAQDTPGPKPETPAPQPSPKSEAPAPQASPPPAAKPDDKGPKAGDPKPSADAKAPDPAKPVPGDLLAAGTVARKGLFPLDDGRAWRYELRTWLTPTSSEEGVGEDLEPPRTHRLDVTVVEPLKIDGRDNRCLKYTLDDEPAQLAYFFEDAGVVLCPQRVLGAGDHIHKYLFAPPQPTLQGDLTVGSKWDWRGKVGTANGKQTFTVLREERVATKVEESFPTVDAILIQTTVENDDDSKGVSSKWFAPGIGIVRELTEVRAEKETFRTEAILTKITKKE